MLRKNQRRRRWRGYALKRLRLRPNIANQFFVEQVLGSDRFDLRAWGCLSCRGRALGALGLKEL